MLLSNYAAVPNRVQEPNRESYSPPIHHLFTFAQFQREQIEVLLEPRPASARVFAGGANSPIIQTR